MVLLLNNTTLQQINFSKVQTPQVLSMSFQTLVVPLCQAQCSTSAQLAFCSIWFIILHIISCFSACHNNLCQPMSSTVTCSVLSFHRLSTFVFELTVGQTGGERWWKIALKDKHLGVCQPANGPCVYSAANWTAARPSYSLLPQHMWGQYIEVCIWYMTNEMESRSRGAGSAKLNEVRGAESGVRGGRVAESFLCQTILLEELCFLLFAFKIVVQNNIKYVHNTTNRNVPL